MHSTIEQTETAPTTLEANDIALIGVGGVAFLGVALIGGAIAGNALLVSMLTVGSAVILWMKMPGQLKEMWGIRHLISLLLSKNAAEKVGSWNWKQFALNHEILLDVTVSVGAFALFGTTVTGILTAAMVGLGISVMLRARKVFLHYWEKFGAARSLFAI